MKFQRDDIFTGLFVLIGSILAIVTLLSLLGYHVFENRVEYVMRMREIAGVQKGTVIKLKDYTVGKVLSVEPIYGASIFFKAQVSIDKDLVLYRGTKLNITKQNVIGDTVIVLYPSFEKKHRLKPGQTLFATNIVNLDAMVTKISDLITNIGTMVGEFGKIAGSSRGSVRNSLKNLNLLLERSNRVLANSEASLVESIRNIAKTTATLDRFAKKVEKNPWVILERPNRRRNQTQSALP